MTPAERAEMETLRERVFQLEKLLNMPGRQFYRGLELTRGEEFLLSVMSRSITVSPPERLTRVGGAVTSLTVRVQRLRKKLVVLTPPISIITAHGEGYYMREQDKERLAALAVITP